jgi:hypothetical protein
MIARPAHAEEHRVETDQRGADEQQLIERRAKRAKKLTLEDVKSDSQNRLYKLDFGVTDELRCASGALSLAEAKARETEMNRNK